MRNLSATIIRGKNVTEEMKKQITAKLAEFDEKPSLTIMRVGENSDQLYYERSCQKVLGNLGIEVKLATFDASLTQEKFDCAFEKINEDESVHGILLLKPLPEHLTDSHASKIVKPEKDVDCFGEKNMLNIYQGDYAKFIPCTAQACLDILDYSKVNLVGAKVTVIGYSLVVGKPLALALSDRGATVKICRTTTKNLKEETKDQDVVISAIGVPEYITAEQLSPETFVIDVGINVTPEGKVVGDVAFDATAEKVAAITPVPGGVGTVTNVVLAQHVVKAFDLQKM